MKDSFPSWLQPLVRASSLGFEAVAQVRKQAYDRGLLSATRVDVPVISVGNLAVGGTGKTPFVAALVERCAAMDSRRVAIVSRGYGRLRPRSQQLVSRGEGPLLGPAAAGDEPWWFANTIKATVVVDPDRVRGARRAIALGAELLVLDDGFSHRRLARDLDIVLLDERSPGFAPWGFAREPQASLQRADLTASQHAIECDIGFALKPISVGPAFTAGRPASSLAGVKVGLWAAIGRPERFETTVSGLGAQVVLRQFARDHQRRGGQHLTEFVAQARAQGAERVIITEKDAARLAGQLPEGAEVLRVQLKFTRGSQRLDEALRRLLS